MIYTEYIANYLGLDIGNKLVAKDIAEIENKEAFIEFIKENINHISLDYKNALQKLTQLKKMYEQEQNRDREEKAQKRSQELEEKFKQIKPILIAELEKYKIPRLEYLKNNGKSYFTKFELDTLKNIGDEKYLIRLCNELRLQEAIEKSFLKIIYAKKTMLTKIEKKVSLVVKKF